MNPPCRQAAPAPRGPRVCAGVFLLLACVFTPGCSTYQAYRARFMEPDYLVTREFFTEAPRHVALLPFASRSGRERDAKNAQVSRRALYQHMSLRSFEETDLRAVDRVLMEPKNPEIRTRLRKFADAVRQLDVLGMTSLLDLEMFFQENEELYREYYRKLVDSIVRKELKADSYVLGISRSYGRLYLVVFSSIALSTRLELRAAKDDVLLWRAQAQRRNSAIPLTLNPLDIPFLLADIWNNSKGQALDLLAYQVFGDVAETIPEIDRPVEPFVKAVRPRTPVFRAPTLWRFRRCGWVPAGTRLPMVLEKRGWFQCEGPCGKPVWLFSADVQLVDQEGKPLGRP
ncbi:MAG: hypothetical protein KJ726_00475 [Verrucomicrobia bacterium]|nr:hypothetical protein [Verrucomicrobiota bacterium]